MNVREDDAAAATSATTITTATTTIVAEREQQEDSIDWSSIITPYHEFVDSRKYNELDSTNHDENTDYHDASPLTCKCGFPEADDMNMVFQPIENHEQDLFWSFLSHYIFVMGGISYIVMSLWDCLRDPVENYYTLDFWAPAFYLFNSVVDIQWALLSKRKEQEKAKLMEQQQWENWHECYCHVTKSWNDDSTADTVGSPDSPTTVHKSPSVQKATNPTAPPSLVKQLLPPFLRRLCRHAAHRGTLYAATTFGIAAFLGVIAVPISYYHHDQSNRGHDDDDYDYYLTMNAITTAEISELLTAASDHVYIISAIIAITGDKRERPWLQDDFCAVAADDEQPHEQQQQPPKSWSKLQQFWNEPEMLEDWGDYMFLVGSLMDGMMHYKVPLDGNIMALVSSFLWMLDALLYLRSDFIFAHRMKEREKNIFLLTQSVKEEHHGPHELL